MVAIHDGFRVHGSIFGADSSYERIETWNSGRDNAPTELDLGQENSGQGYQGWIGGLEAKGEVVEAKDGNRNEPIVYMSDLIL